MKVVVNGAAREIADGSTLQQLLVSLRVDGGPVAVEVNSVVIRRAQQPEHRLEPGDRVEVVTFVGGG